MGVEKAYSALCHGPGDLSLPGLYPDNYINRYIPGKCKGDEEEELKKSLDGGLGDESCSALTGMPTIDIRTRDDHEQLNRGVTFESVKDYFEKGYLLTCSEGQGKHALAIVNMFYGNDGLGYVHLFEPNNKSEYADGSRGNMIAHAAERVPGENGRPLPGIFQYHWNNMAQFCQHMNIGCFEDWELNVHDFEPNQEAALELIPNGSE